MRELVFAHIGKRDSCVAQRKVRLAIQCLLILLQGLVKPAVVRLSSQFFGVGEDLIDGGAQPGQFVLVPPLMRFLGNAEQFGGGGGGFLGNASQRQTVHPHRSAPEHSLESRVEQFQRESFSRAAQRDREHQVGAKRRDDVFRLIRFFRPGKVPRSA